MRLIDAHALNAAFLDYPKMLTFNGSFCAVNLDAVLLEIRRTPTIEAEPVRHGRWVNVIAAVIDSTGNCTNCGEEAVWRTRKKPYTICPNCGAKMDGGTDGATH